MKDRDFLDDQVAAHRLYLDAVELAEDCLNSSQPASAARSLATAERLFPAISPPSDEAWMGCMALRFLRAGRYHARLAEFDSAWPCIRAAEHAAKGLRRHHVGVVFAAAAFVSGLQYGPTPGLIKLQRKTVNYSTGRTRGVSLFNLGWTQLRLGDRDGAFASFSRSVRDLSQEEEWPARFRWAGALFIKDSDRDVATEEIRMAIAGLTQPLARVQAHLDLASISVLRGDATGARATLGDVFGIMRRDLKAPPGSWVWRDLGRLEERLTVEEIAAFRAAVQWVHLSRRPHFRVA